MTKTSVCKKKVHRDIRNLYEYIADSQKVDFFRNTEKAPSLKTNYEKNVCLYKGVWPQKDASN